MFLNLIVGILFLTIIWFLIQYGLKFRQEKLKLEDYRNEILAEKAKISEERGLSLRAEAAFAAIQKAKEKEEKKQQEHQNKLKAGYKLYKWKGIELWKTIDEKGLNPYKKIELYKGYSNNWHMIKHVEGTGYFKSFSDLTMYLNSDFIELKYWEIL